ncbi:hypothetical protein BIW11_01951 [Tropilaelaps mercedesae]|uniref:FK506-binding protein n=1 Tax=Tropilaelaps mercedesae TaxID=418985 RepID=A0A1V9X6D5_9ACAR|nr:hypothetical protein BIW11_01951 [Tropilaelaps mercedesae]
MFWGLQLEPTLRYSQQVPKGFRITKATLEVDSSTGKNRGVVQVFIEKDGNEYPIATLKSGDVYDCSLDLRFSEGEDICFFVKGDGVVYLTGHELYPDDEDESFYPIGDSDSDDDEDEADMDLKVSDLDAESSESDGPEIEDVTGREDLLALPAPAKKTPQQSNGIVEEDSVDDEDFDEDDDVDEDEVDEDLSDDDEEEEEEEEESSVAKPGQKRPSSVANGKTPDIKKMKTLVKETPSKNGQPTPGKPDGQAKTPKSEKTPKADKATKAEKSPKAEKTPKTDRDSQDVKIKTPQNDGAGTNQVKIEDIQPGTGAVAKRGKTVHVYYTGMLMNGKKFDSCTSGKPFSFKLGVGSVIQGWDQGLEGMKVGGKRRLVIPPRLAYGKRGGGPIPPNATLRFEVELKAVN